MGLSFSLSFGATISLGELSRLKIHLTYLFFFFLKPLRFAILIGLRTALSPDSRSLLGNEGMKMLLYYKLRS